MKDHAHSIAHAGQELCSKQCEPPCYPSSSQVLGLSEIVEGEIAALLDYATAKLTPILIGDFPVAVPSDENDRDMPPYFNDLHRSLERIRDSVRAICHTIDRVDF